MLSKLLNIKKGDIISIVGAGGKSSTMKKLGEELKNNKILLTTTTKIGLNEFTEYDYKIIGTEEMINTFSTDKYGVYLGYENEDIQNKKCIGYSPIFIGNCIDYFHVIISECDGSKKMFLKGWNDFEPVIVVNTTKTIGIINLTLLNKVCSNENIHRFNLFTNISGYLPGNNLTIENIINVIKHKNGLFKNSNGEKILIIHEMENIYKEQFKLLEKIYVDKIIYTYNHGGEYYEM